MDALNENSDRDAIVSEALRFHRDYQADNLSDNQLSVSDAIVKKWADAGMLDQLLAPLLDDDRIPVRFAAASYLAKLQNNKQALDVLTQISQIKAKEYSFFTVQAGLFIDFGRRVG